MESDSLSRLNSLPEHEAVSELLKCCGSQRWAMRMSAQRPFGSVAAIKESAEKIWSALSPADWVEAFHSHPKIGEKKAAKETGAVAEKWSAQEQSGISQSSSKTVDRKS